MMNNDCNENKNLTVILHKPSNDDVILEEKDLSNEDQESMNTQVKVSTGKKYIIFAMAVLSQILNQASTDELYPALPIIQMDFNSTATVTNFTVAVHSLVIGLLSAIWGTYADNYGRKFAFIASMIFSVIGNCGSALSFNIEMLIGFRVISAIGAAASYTLGVGMINDVFKDHEKGKALSWYVCANSYCAACAPFIGGLFTQYMGWRSIYWSLVIGYSFVGLVSIVSFVETNPFVINEKRRQQKKKNWMNRIKEHSKMNPFASLKLLKFVNILFCCVYLGWMGFVNNSVDISFTWAYSTQYHFSSTLVGLFYMCGLVGTTIGSFIGGMMSDRIYMRKIERAKEANNPIFPEMRLSKSSLFIAAFIMATSFCGYGWSVEKNIHFSAGIIFQAFAQFGFTIAGCFITVYVIQSFPKHVSSAQACIQTIKCILLAAGRFTAIELQNLIGSGILYTILGGLLIFTIPFITYIQCNSLKWQNKLANI
ncbi:major facilitator superfamily domain-containing protein [Circinella umbellata]|nr:major facilitator superfamily domain-containing protein [Circinella umbellata]